ncbi:MAG: leucine-rich repeat protein, partial [Candidatus Methanomethylophilaceae archaeon]|nr:leucine-rich repeat protein [Candidatus Methanomethylophilaceae archaeon]
MSIRGGVAEIGHHAFYDCDSVKDIRIFGMTKIIGESAFENCSKLQTVDLMEGIYSIGDYA